jgi:hypothetical protein
MALSEAIARVFVQPERAAAAEVLDLYDGNEPLRVRLAVLALSSGNLDELRDMMRAAQLDYRDVLYWAEYPDESKSMTREEAAARYRALGVPLPGSLQATKRRS